MVKCYNFFSFRMSYITQGGPKNLIVLVALSLCFWITKKFRLVQFSKHSSYVSVSESSLEEKLNF